MGKTGVRMEIDRSVLLRVLGFVGAVVAVWLVSTLTPGRSLARCQERLLQAGGDRNWDRVRDLMDADYRDAWGQNREEAVSRASQVLQNFLALDIMSEDTSIERDGPEAVVSARIRLRGKGNALGEAVLEGTNALSSHFQFAWRRKSWKPWDWKLVSLSQPEIDTTWMP